MNNKETGLYQKYIVSRVDGTRTGWTFTLEEHDPLAVPALIAYATAAEEAGYVTLARDLRIKVDEMTGATEGPAEEWNR